MEHVELAQGVNDVLSRYIVVHNALFGLSIRKVLPDPGLFKPLDFARYKAVLNDMLVELDEVDKAIDRMHPGLSTSSPTGLFLLGLRRYSKALADTIALLGGLCHNLYLKSQHPGKFTWAQHKRAVEEYKLSVDRYRALGRQLNDLFAALQS